MAKTTKNSPEDSKSNLGSNVSKPLLELSDQITPKNQKSSVLKRAEEVEQFNLEAQKQILQETDELTSGILKAAIEIQKNTEIGSMKEDLANLRSAISALKTTSALAMQSQNVSKPSLPSHSDCGCGCEETKEKKCCIEIYGSGVRVIKAADGIVPTLELILAIQAAGYKGVFPGLTSQINVNQNVGWVKVDWPITKVCVPCSQQMTIPLTVEAMDIDKVLSVPEKGANTGAITLSCTCNPNSVIIDVNLSSGSAHPGEKKGQIMVEVSARKVQGGCCC